MTSQNKTNWRNFGNAIEKAKITCESSGNAVSGHFVDLVSGSQRQIEDIALTRYVCYLIAQNGDSTKNEIAFAQTYFAVYLQYKFVSKKL